jgi:hypothetical protein
MVIGAALRAAAVLCLLLRFVGAASGTEWAQATTHQCDVVIAGGSLASAAAAVAAGEASNSTTRVCFLEITDWPGGQASAGGIPAMDFGLQYLNFPHNIPRTLAELLTDGEMGGPTYNPGECQYLPKCFAPEWAAEWVLGRLAALPNVAVFLNTTVVKVNRDAAGRVTELRAVQRTPTPAHPSGWGRPLSDALPDWYSPAPSAYFDKAQLQFVVAPAGVVVESTEFGDVLVLADGVAVGQGVELGAENSTEYEEYCGNAAAFSVLAEWGTAPLPSDTSPPRTGTARPLPDWLKVRRYWTMANHTPRSFDPYNNHDHADVPHLAPGDHYAATTGCNDLAHANVFLPLATARATARVGVWEGGMNLTAVAMAEAQTWACFRTIQNGSLSARPEESGTRDGLSKMLYLRESRRSMTGVGAFRLCHTIMSASNTGPGGAGCSTAADPPGRSSNSTGYQFLDTVAIGAPQPLFGFDVHGTKWCSYPRYMSDKIRVPNSTIPYFIPFRALTVAGAPNLLVAGKSMATSFLTNSVTRLHPNEWASGTAAGVAAAMMSELNLSSVQMAVNVSRLQDRLRSLGVPLAFNFTPAQTGSR